MKAAEVNEQARHVFETAIVWNFDIDALDRVAFLHLKGWFDETAFLRIVMMCGEAITLDDRQTFKTAALEQRALQVVLLTFGWSLPATAIAEALGVSVAVVRSDKRNIREVCIAQHAVMRLELINIVDVARARAHVGDETCDAVQAAMVDLQPLRSEAATGQQFQLLVDFFEGGAQ